MRDVIDDWLEEWFGEGCPAWTWPLVLGGPMIVVAIAIAILS